MSELADQDRVRRQSWAAPGGSHDRVVKLLKIALPAVIGMLLAFLALVPLAKNADISFILDKDKVDVAKERMRLQAARYQGVDDQGRPFTVLAKSAVQPTSRQPIVDVNGLTARLDLERGPARLAADNGRYNLETQRVDVLGPIMLTTDDGYRLDTSDVTVDLTTRQMVSNGRVEGKMPLGAFSADRMEADIGTREVTLTGRARLHIVQGGLR